MSTQVLNPKADFDAKPCECGHLYGRHPWYANPRKHGHCLDCACRPAPRSGQSDSTAGLGAGARGDAAARTEAPRRLTAAEGVDPSPSAAAAVTARRL